MNKDKILTHLATRVENELNQKNQSGIVKFIKWNRPTQLFVVWEEDMNTPTITEKWPIDGHISARWNPKLNSKIFNIISFYAKYADYIKTSKYHTWYMSYVLGGKDAP